MCILTIKMLDEIIRIKNRILCRVKIKIKIYIKFYYVLEGGMGKLEQRGFEKNRRIYVSMRLFREQNTVVLLGNVYGLFPYRALSP